MVRVSYYHYFHCFLSFWQGEQIVWFIGSFDSLGLVCLWGNAVNASVCVCWVRFVCVLSHFLIWSVWLLYWMSHCGSISVCLSICVYSSLFGCNGTFSLFYCSTKWGCVIIWVRLSVCPSVIHVSYSPFGALWYHPLFILVPMDSDISILIVSKVTMLNSLVAPSNGKSP